MQLPREQATDWSTLPRVPFPRMNGAGYKLLGFVVWRGAKWYVRKRVRSVRTIALAGAGGVAALAAVGAIAKRAAAG